MPMILGFAGGIAVLASFAGVAFDRLRSDSAAYHGLNLGGALALVASGLAVAAWPSVAVNVVWALISLVGLGRTVTPVSRVRSLRPLQER